MTPLKRALIEKAGHDHGFEHTVSAPGAAVTLGSARHQAKAEVSWAQQGYAMALVRHLLGLSNGMGSSCVGLRLGMPYICCITATSSKP